MRIAICDDVAADRRAIAAALGDYLTVRGLTAEVLPFARPRELIASAERAPFDLYLLDVLLNDNLTGIDLVRTLQPNAHKPPVVFFSTSCEYAVDAFAVEAISYLQKSWDKASFTRVMDLALERCRKQTNQLLTFRTSFEIARFAASEIESVEVGSTVNYLKIRRMNGQAVTVRGSIRAFAEHYREQIHLVPAGRSLLVNPAQIASLGQSSVRFFSGRTLEVPRSAHTALAHDILSLSAP